MGRTTKNSDASNAVAGNVGSAGEAGRPLNWLRAHWFESFLALVAAAILLIARDHNLAIHDLQRDLAEQQKDQASELDAVRGDLRVANRKLDTLYVSITAMLLDAKPDKAAIMKRLVSDQSFAQGVEQFKAGEYSTAFSTWEHSAARGTTQSALAIQAAKATLEVRIADPETPEPARVQMRAALTAAPHTEPLPTEIHDLMYRKPVEQPPKR